MEEHLKILEKCEICPHKCKVNRFKNKGICKARANIKIALFSVHKYEEPCVSGKNGSGTIFFSNCNLMCKFCQNYEISQEGLGKEISIKDLANIFLEQQKKGVHNINLVSPTSYALHIIEALKIAKKSGLNIPIIYNTNGYENIETIEKLKNYIDVYMPDLKYAEEMLGKKFSGVDNYFEIAIKSIKKMYEQVGGVKLDENGVIKKGVIIRHLVLPNHIQNSKKVLKWIEQNMPKDVIVSCMAQYFPSYKAKNIAELSRKLTKNEYKNIENYLYSLNINNGYIQNMGKSEEEFVPKWNIT